jgi:hypothetical protein
MLLVFSGMWVKSSFLGDRVVEIPIGPELTYAPRSQEKRADCIYERAAEGVEEPHHVKAPGDITARGAVSKLPGCAVHQKSID